MFKIEQLREWANLINTPLRSDDPEVVAGREAENFLKSRIETNLTHKGAYGFLAKRIPSDKHMRRFEIDYMVLTKKQLHFLEVKNWSGELFQVNGSWVQNKRDGRQIRHPHLTKYNSIKTDVALEYLKNNGIFIDRSFVTQKVIFMNKKLQMDNIIENDPDVIPAYRLNNYLNSQKGSSYIERFMHSIIEVCLDSEQSQILINGLFNSLTNELFNKIINVLSRLRTWDRICYHGGRIDHGDALKFFANGHVIDLTGLPTGEEINFNWCRNKVLGLFKHALFNMNLGTVYIDSKFIPLTCNNSYLKFQPAGAEIPIEIQTNHLNWVLKG